MDLNPATSAAPQEKWFHLVVRENGSTPDSECPRPPQYGIFGVDYANPVNMIPLGPDSGLSPAKLAAVEKFTECVTAMGDAGLSVYCPCQLKGSNGATVPTLFVVPEGAENTERRVSVSDETEPMPSVPSEPLTEPGVSVQGAEASPSDGSTASANRDVQIVKDFILALQLDGQLNNSSTDQRWLRQHSSTRAGRTDVSASQSGCSSSLADRSEPVVSVAAPSQSAGSAASVSRHVQIVEDYMFARQLDNQLNNSSTDQRLLRQHSTSRTADHTGRSSSADQADISASPLVWSTGRYYN